MDTMMIKLSVLFLLALQTLSSANPLDIKNTTEHSNVSLMNPHLDGGPEITANGSMPRDLPLLSVAKLTQRRWVQSSSITADVGTTLEWVTWNNYLPNNAISIYNGYVDRIDYVCKYMCNAGFYNPSMGPYCHYPSAEKEYSGSPFEILVNEDNFEILEWKDDSYGSVPQNSVRTCPGEDTYVGKNKYGLGKVVTQDKAFYLPWKGYEYWYNYYQVLTINQNVISQHIYDVRYNTDESKILKYPPEIMRKTTISNYECHPVVKTDTLSKTYQVEYRWDITSSITFGVKTSIKARIPSLFSVGIEFSTEETFMFSREKTVMEAITDSVSVELTAPPNHACMVTMVQYKYKADIPFTARLRRIYSNGEIHTMSISGTYNSVQIGEVHAVVDRCEPLNSTPCP
ncbi:natterin-3-like isoform X2 [Thunnus albacares]|uniref:natterin-3-like isoform X2 n=1 Tax=Thunnus albacares TaxID=8236 RepID=UPI001CF607FE|nr:natterin-3-like isoform X2 [Thunnus albacares]